MTKREKEILVAQLIAANAQIEATLAVLCAEDEECQHPAETVLDMSTMGGEEKYRCGLCGVESAKPFNTVEG